MIRELDPRAPRYVSFVKEKLQTVEAKFKKLGYIPLLSSATGGIEVLAGTAASVMALASAFFYKARLLIPRPFVSKERNVIWAQSCGYKQSTQLLMDSVKVVAMGILKAVPGVGNLISYSINTLVAQTRTAEKERHEAQGRAEELQQQLRTQAEAVEEAYKQMTPLKEAAENSAAEVKRLQDQLDAHQKNIEEIEKPLRQEIRAKQDEIAAKNEELSRLDSNLGDSQKRAEKLQTELSQAKGLLNQATQRLAKIELKAQEDVRGLQEKMSQVLAARAEQEASLVSLQDEVQHLKAENAHLKQQLEASQSGTRASRIVGDVPRKSQRNFTSKK